nr:hypothetical protein [Escherichia coli]
MLLSAILGDPQADQMASRPRLTYVSCRLQKLQRITTKTYSCDWSTTSIAALPPTGA